MHGGSIYERKSRFFFYTVSGNYSVCMILMVNCKDGNCEDHDGLYDMTNYAWNIRAGAAYGLYLSI
jgi:hypothetical protein